MLIRTLQMENAELNPIDRRAQDIIEAKKTGHSGRPAFIAWEVAVSPDMPTEEQRAVLVAHQERLTFLRKEARSNIGLLSRENFDLLGQAIQDVVRRLQALKTQTQQAWDLTDRIIETYRDGVGERNWQVIIDRAYALQELAREERRPKGPDCRTRAN